MLNRWIYFLSFYLYAFLCIAQQSNKYYNLNIKDGIISNHIDYCIVDSYGYLWLASYDGVQRWDGVQGYKYVNETNNINSLPSNISNVIFEDFNADIWIGTLQGLCKIDRKTNTLSRINLPQKNSPVNSIIQNTDSTIWIGTSNGLFYINTNTNKVYTPINALATVTVFDLKMDKKGNIWVGTFNDGLIKINPKTKNKISFKDEQKVSDFKIRKIFIDNEQKIWLGTFDKGISVLNSNEEIDFTLNIKEEIRTIYQNKNKEIYIGTIDNTLLIFDSKKQNVFPIELLSENNRGKKAEGIFCITEDKFGNTWFATHGMGMFYTNLYKNKIKQHLSESFKHHNTSEKIINCIVVDQLGNEWAATENAGLFKTDKNGFTTNFTKQNGLSSNSIQHLSLNGNQLWIATFGGGLMCLNILNHQIQTFQYNPKNNNSLITNNIKVVLATDSLVWIGTHGNGIAVLDKKNMQFSHKNNPTNFNFDLGEPAWVNHIYIDKQNRVWISTCFGLYMVKSNRLKRYHKEIGNSGLTDNYINMITEDNEGKIWLISEMGGLQYFDAIKQKFISFTHPDIPFTLKSIVYDEKNGLWMGSNEGLIYLNQQNNKVQKYTENNGFQGTHFIHKSIFKTSHNKIYIGGLNGYNSFFSNSIVFPNEKLTLSFETAVLKGNSLDTTINLHNKNYMQIPYYYKFNSFYFSVPNLYSNAQLKLKYQIKNLDDTWIELENGKRELFFSGLPAGKYQLIFKYSLDGENWTAFNNKLSLQILPPWWQTVWFKISVFVFTVLSVIFVFYWRTKRIRKRNKLLKKEVEKRTYELQETNASLLEQIDYTLSQKEDLEYLNSQYIKQTKTIIKHQDTISAQNRNLHNIINHLNTKNNGELSALLHKLNHSSEEKLIDFPIKIALFQVKNQAFLYQTLSPFAVINVCVNSQELLEGFPDFIVIDSDFKGEIDSNSSHIPIVKIFEDENYITSMDIIADIHISIENINKEFPEKIKNYYLHRKLINEEFLSNEVIHFENQEGNEINQKFLSHLVEIIEKNIANSELNHEILESELNISRTVLYSKIKQFTGLGVHEFIKTIRVKKSVELLKSKKHNVSQVAYEVGFSSPSYYIRCFVKQFGLPPKEYMKKLK